MAQRDEEEEERRDQPRSGQEREMEELYERPISVRQRRNGLRRLGQRYRRWA